MTTTKSTLDSGFAAAVAAIRGLTPADSVLLTCHVAPDGDALGSMLGFGLALRDLGLRQVQASFPEPFEVPESFRFLPGLEMLVAPSRVVPRPDLGVSFDASNVGRLGELAAPLTAAPQWIVLDHHASNSGFGGVRLIDSEAAATVVIAAELVDQLGAVLTAEIATCFYLGLATDTGSFRFSSTTADVHELAARLVRAGAQPSEVARRVFDSRSSSSIRLLAEVLSRMELDTDASHGLGLVSSYATLADLQRHGLKADVVDGFLEIVRSTAEADVTCMLKPVIDGEWAVSLRSRGGTDVSAVAVALGGGGHRFAAGFTGYGDANGVIANVKARLGAQQVRGD